MSVTSSGLSSIKRTNNTISGLLVDMLWAIFFKRVVLPALGGATITPLCPFPIGHIISISLEDKSEELVSNFILSFGYIGTRFSKFFLPIAFSGCSPFTFSTYNKALNFSPSLASLTFPIISSPVLRLNLLIWAGDTYISSLLVR